MIRPSTLYNAMKKHGIEFFCGVPDSLLKDFCAFVTMHSQKEDHIITPNEGNAIALATGYHLATSRIPAVYMQNSGLGNCVNPLTSLCDPEVYSIPMLLIIGWRGEPGIHDEPQHVKQGKITLKLLECLGIEYSILSNDESQCENNLATIIDNIKKNSAPYALIVKSGTFEKFILSQNIEQNYKLSREEAIEIIVGFLNGKDIIVSTTGKLSRELYEVQLRNKLHVPQFLTVGSMGHASSISLGVALKLLDKNIYCLDGDGAAIMHMGSFTSIGNSKLRNLKHIILNNGSHESVGGQATKGFDIDFCGIAKSSGYQFSDVVTTKDELKNILPLFIRKDGPSFLEVRVNMFSRSNLGRPTSSPIQNKQEFMLKVQDNIL